MLSAFGLQAAKCRPDADGTGAVHGLYGTLRLAGARAPLPDLNRCPPSLPIHATV